MYTHYKEWEKYKIECNGYIKKNFELQNGKTRTQYDGKKSIEYIDKTNACEIFKRMFKEMHITQGVSVKITKSNNYSKFTNVMQQITFTNDDYKTVLKKFQKDKNAFLFLDPPYMFSNNKHYQNQKNDSDNTDMLYEISNFIKDKKTKCKIMLIINKLKIIEYLFKDFVKMEYQKCYQLGKRRELHLVITNY